MWVRAELVIVAGAFALGAGCKVGPDFERPVPPSIEGYVSGPDPTGAGSQRFHLHARIARDWWRLFRCRALDSLVAEALAGSPNLRAGVALLQQSQEALRAGHGVYYPQVDLDANASRQRFNPSQFGSPQPVSVFNLYTFEATASYVLGVWGGKQRAVEALGAEADAQRYALAATYLMLTSNVVTTAIAAAGYRDQLEVTRALMARQREQIEITRAQYAAGLTPYTSVAAQQAELAATQATVPAIAQRMARAEHLLARLVGKSPATWRAPRLTLADFTLPADIPLGVPSQLVRRRPDVLLAEARLHARTAEIGVATAELLPKLVLTGSFGLQSSVLDQLLRWSSRLWSIVGGVTMPLFDGGRRWHRRKQALYARDAALARYQETVLVAFEQVANALRALQHDAAAVRAQRAAIGYAGTTRNLARSNLEAGTLDYLELLGADAQYLQSRLGYIQAQAQRLQDTALLFVALGGGWWSSTTRPRD